MRKQLEDSNPFRYGCVVEDSFYCPRPSLERQLAGFIRSGQNAVVHGERRMGKTSLINAVVRGIRGRAGAKSSRARFSTRPESATRRPRERPQSGCAN